MSRTASYTWRDGKQAWTTRLGGLSVLSTKQIGVAVHTEVGFGVVGWILVIATRIGVTMACFEETGGEQAAMVPPLPTDDGCGNVVAVACEELRSLILLLSSSLFGQTLWLGRC